MRGSGLALALAYPVLATWAGLSHRPGPTAAAVTVLLLLVLLPGLARARAWAWLALVAGAAGLWLLVQNAQAQLVLFLPPVALNAAFAWLFGHTLGAGRMPLIERIVRLLHPPSEPLPAGVLPYARRLTAVWTALFACLALVNAVLALCAVPGGVLGRIGIAPPWPVPLAAWSWFANVLNYLLVAALFALEYAYRRRRFPDQPFRGFGDFLRRMAALGPALWRSSGTAST